MKNADVYQTVTNNIIANMSQDSWQKMWKNPWPVSMAGHLYRGVNQLTLGFSEFKSPVWGSFKQIKENGGTVKKGEKGTFVVFTKTLTDTDSTGAEKKTWLIRFYYVFNTDQCNWTEKGQTKVLSLSQGSKNEVTRSRTADEIIENMPNRPTIEYATGAKPCYQPGRDVVRMPHPEQFENMESFYRSMFHELTHSVGHHSRLNRDLVGYSESDKVQYSKEELIAELGAAYLNVISKNPVSQNVSASYINSWKKVLSDNTDWILWAASRASKAVDYILDIKGNDSNVDVVSAEVETVVNPL